MSINKAILVGNLGQAPELRRSEKDKPFCTFSVATNHTFSDAASQRQSRTEWHQVVCFGLVAENCARFLKKGRQVYVEGRIQSQRWQDKEGVERVTNRVVANTVQFLGTKPQSAEDSAEPVEPPQAEPSEASNDDIPW